MPSRYTLPFGGLNTLPGIDSVQDVTLVIPRLGEIDDIVQREVLDRTDIDEAIARAFVGADVPDGPIIDVIVAELEGALNIDVPGEGAIVDQIVAELEDELNVDFPDVPDIDQFDELLQQNLPDDLAADVIENAEVNIEGIFGPLSEDFEEALGDLIEFDFEDIPGLDEIREELDEAIGDALDGLSPDVNGVEFWSDPIEFGKEVWREERVLLADPDLLDELDRVVEEAD